MFDFVIIQWKVSQCSKYNTQATLLYEASFSRQHSLSYLKLLTRFSHADSKPPASMAYMYTCYYTMGQANNTMHSQATRQSQFSCSVLTLLLFACAETWDTWNRGKYAVRPESKVGEQWHDHTAGSRLFVLLPYEDYKIQERGRHVQPLSETVHCCSNGASLINELLPSASLIYKHLFYNSIKRRWQ